MFRVHNDLYKLTTFVDASFDVSWLMIDGGHCLRRVLVFARRIRIHIPA
jgi:hypothetical protein